MCNWRRIFSCSASCQLCRPKPRNRCFFRDVLWRFRVPRRGRRRQREVVGRGTGWRRGREGPLRPPRYQLNFQNKLIDQKCAMKRTLKMMRHITEGRLKTPSLQDCQPKDMKNNAIGGIEMLEQKRTLNGRVATGLFRAAAVSGARRGRNWASRKTKITLMRPLVLRALSIIKMSKNNQTRILRSFWGFEDVMILRKKLKLFFFEEKCHDFLFGVIFDELIFFEFQ